jgi:hypothetical protein
MKTFRWMLMAIFSVTLMLVGCSKQGGVDTTPLEQNFKSGETAVKASVDKAIAAIKAADYSGALAELKALGNNAKLTPEQQQAIKDVMAQVEKAVADAAAKVQGEAGKAADDLKKSVPK